MHRTASSVRQTDLQQLISVLVLFNVDVIFRVSDVLAQRLQPTERVVCLHEVRLQQHLHLL